MLKLHLFAFMQWSPLILGYMGDSSDSDSEHEAGVEWDADPGKHYPSHLPRFWLILKIQPDRVESFFHCR